MCVGSGEQARSPDLDFKLRWASLVAVLGVFPTILIVIHLGIGSDLFHLAWALL